MLLRFGFWAATLFTFLIAVLPIKHGPALLPWDKAQHFLAFYTLTLLALAAFTRVNPWLIALGLSAFGALIEFVQGLSFVHRDRDLHDWIADTAAIIAVLAPLYLARWRRS
jgi:VanZ family protein